MTLSKEKEDFSKYGKSFQESLVQLMLDDRPFCDQLEEVLDVNFFELKYLQEFSKLLLNYRTKYKVHPNREIISTLVRTKLENHHEVLQIQIRDYYARVQVRDKVDGFEYIKETSLDFCKKQKLKGAILRSVELMNRSSYDEIKGVIGEALSLGLDNNHGYDYVKDFEERYVDEVRFPITTGWPAVDNISKGGLGVGELGVVIAPTGVGKSFALVHLGAQSLKKGKNVLHYTLELSDKVVGLRYDSNLTGVPLDDLKQFKEQVYENCCDIPGKLIVKQYPARSASTNTIRSHLEKLTKKNHEIGMIIVDYGDLLKPTTNYREKRDNLEAIYEDLRAIAVEYQCPVWTASQSNRTSLNAEVITMEAIAEAFSKCFPADFIFSLSRTIEETMDKAGKMFVAKNRNGPTGLIFPAYIDLASAKIDIMDQPLEGDAVTDALSPLKRQEKHLKDKYKEFLKESNDDDV